jgi:hypothetical protein
VNVVGHDFQSVNLGLQFFRLLVQHLSKSLLNLSNQNFQSILGAPNQVIFERVRRSCTDSISGVHQNVSVTPTLDIRKKTNRRIAFLCQLRAVPCGF